MNLEEQFKVIFYAFIYGMLFVSTYKLLKKLKFKRIVFKLISEFLFCNIHLLIFYFFLYKINSGILNMYVFIFLVLGGMFCKVFYFGDKKR